MKSRYISSTTGRMPAIAAPTPRPIIARLGDRRVAHAVAEAVVQPAGETEDVAAGRRRRCRRRTRARRSASSTSSALRIASIMRNTGASADGGGGSASAGRAAHDEAVQRRDGGLAAGRVRRLRRPASRSRATDSARGASASSPTPAWRRRGRVRRASGSRAAHSCTSSGGAVALRVTFVVAVPPVGGGLDDHRARRRRAHHGARRPSPPRSRRRRCRRPRRDDAVSGGPAFERRRVLRSRGGELGVAVVLAEEDHRRCQTAARLTASWKAPCATAPSPKNATATLPSFRSCAAVAAPTAIGRPAATIPLAPKIPSVGSAMCIDPPRPRLVPASLAISSANIPAGSRPLARQCPWPAVGRGDHVGGTERPARTDGASPPGRSTGGRSRGPRRRGRAHGDALLEAPDHQHPPMHLEQVAIEKRRSAEVDGHGRVLYWSEGGSRWPTEIDIPEHFPESGDVAGRRVVMTGGGAGLGRVLAHAFSRRAPPSRWSRGPPTTSNRSRRSSRARRSSSGRRDRRGDNEAVADAAVDEWGGLDAWICNAGDLSRRGRPARDAPRVWREVLEVNLTGAFLGARAAARVMGRAVAHLHRFGARRTTARQGSRRTARRRPG